MSIKIAEVLAAMPRTPSKQEAMAQASVESYAGIPTRRFHRLWSLGTLEAELAFAYFAWWIRGVFRSAEQREQDLLETNLGAAFAMLRSMTYLRGAVMKLGQMFANLPEITPEEMSEVLAALHFEAPPMHFSLISEYLTNELGDGFDQRFSMFEQQAFAAASLGQVHLASLASGEKVAVKVQYPGIADAVKSDLANLRMLGLPLRLSDNWENLNEQMEEVCELYAREADYEQEAAFQTTARELFREADRVMVPRVFTEHSTERVLTTEYLPGLHLNEFLAGDPSQEERDRYGELMYRACFRMYYEGRMTYGDPHPGNFIFMDDGRLGLIDFGNMRPYTEEELQFLAKAERSLTGSDIDLMACFRAVTGLTDEEIRRPGVFELLNRSHQWVTLPLRYRDGFDFSDPAHLKEGTAWYGEALRIGFTRSHPVNVSIYRCMFGLRAMLYRMKAKVNVYRIHEEESPAWGVSAT
jgi:aarF domain-containing kinase